MGPPPSSSTLSSPFASRELNGETLLDELADLRAAGVGQKHLNDCVAAVRPLRRTAPGEAAGELRQIAAGRFQVQPELAGLLVRWAARLRTPGDVAELCAHLERLALTSALIGAMARGAGRLPNKGVGR